MEAIWSWGLWVFLMICMLVAGLALLRWQWRRQHEPINVAVAQRRAELDAYWGPNARAATATAEELERMRKDRADFFSIMAFDPSNPYWGTAGYNNAREQAILEGARHYAAVNGVTLREGRDLYFRASAGINAVVGTISNPGPTSTGTIDPGTHGQVCYTGGTPDPREYRP